MGDIEANKEEKEEPTEVVWLGGKVFSSKVVRQVFRELSIVDRLQCEGVNRQWKAIVGAFGWTGQKKLSRKIVCEGASRSQTRKFKTGSLIALFRRVGANLIELDLESFYPRVSPDIFHSLKLLPNLAKLRIRKYNLHDVVCRLPKTLIELYSNDSNGIFSEQSLMALSRKCPKLETISFHGYHPDSKVSVSVMKTFLGKYPSLKKLRLYGNFIEIESNPSATLTSLGQLQELEELYVSKVGAFEDEALASVAAGCPRLKRFTLDKVPVSKKTIYELDQHPSLFDFELKWVGRLSVHAKKEINRRWKMRKYEVWAARMSTDDSILRDVLSEVKSARKNFRFDPYSIAELVEQGIVPLLAKCLDSTNAVLQYQSLRALVVIVKAPGQDEEVLEQSLCAIGKIIAKKPKFRDLCIELGIIECLLGISDARNPPPTIGVLLQASCIFAICLNVDSPLSMDIIELILPALIKLLYTNENERKIIYYTTKAISNIAERGNEEVQLLVDLGVVPRLVSLLTNLDGDVQGAALYAVGCIAATYEHTQLLLDSDVLKVMPPLISHRMDYIVEHAVWFLSNIAASYQVQAVMDTYLVPVIVNFLARGTELSKTYASRAIWSIAKKGRPKHVLHLVDLGVISPILDMLDHEDRENVQCAINGLKHILEKSGDRKAGIWHQIVGSGAWDKIKRLRNDESEDISKVANEIVDKLLAS